MKKNILFILVTLLLYSCEEVIDIDLQNSEPKLVIEASVNVLKDGTSNAVVTLSQTAPFFENDIPAVTDALVSITSSTGEVYSFNHTQNGIYTASVLPVLENTYTLEVIHQNETYTATEALQTVTEFEEVIQNNEGGFGGDQIQLKAYFTDPGGIQNYYLSETLSVRGDERRAFNDEFFDGNRINDFYLGDNLAPGDVVTFNLYGVDEYFFNFMVVLLQQTDNGGGGPFETQPATVRGNIVNQTNSDNFPLGYFRISELSTIVYTVE
mgnify:FL=1